MTYKEIIAKVADETGMSKTTVDKIYRMYWKAVRGYVSSLPLKEDLTDEEFNKLRPNINIPSIGKLNVTLERYRNMKKFYEVVKGRLNKK